MRMMNGLSHKGTLKETGLFSLEKAHGDVIRMYSSLGIWLLASAGDRALGQMDPRNEFTATFVLSSELRAMQLVPDEADLVITAQRAQEVSQQAGLSLSSVMNENENAKQQCQPIEVSPCENQDGNSKMSPFRSRNVFTKRPRNSSPVKLEIKLQESDDECDLIIDVPPLVVNKKPRISRKCTNGKREKELASVMHAELHDSAIVDILGRAGEESERMMILQKSGKGLNNYETLDMVSPKANEMYLPDVNTDILKVLVERDALAYTEDKRVSSAAFFEADIQKGILQQGNAETNVLVKPFVQERTTNEDCLSSGRVTQSVLCTGRSSKDETIIERPYEEIIVNTEKRQSIQENGGNDSPKDTYPYPASYLNKKGSEKTLLSSSVEEVEPSEEETELSESDDPLEECRRIFDEFEREIQKKNSDKQAHRGNADLNLLETKVNLTGQKRRIAHRAKFDVSTQRRPSIPESGSKVPFETRQRYIGLFLAECFKMCGTVNEAIDKCYTTRGLELTRVTVVDAKLQVVYDTFVKPDGKVIDYDIRLSGATEDDLQNTKTSLRDVQAILLNLFSADTILIGHGLENDLFALKLIHNTVVDTSVVFPHRLGFPHKRALRSLMADYLRRIRQDDGKSTGSY
ncbi:RNA exonuclease 1 [Grus japonensis]|uniref:RNA exonuclease 1 n=1 Tax=Grus japonensis TaxID=30415 RepID=A0ABC9YAT8_GRUJA